MIMSNEDNDEDHNELRGGNETLSNERILPSGSLTLVSHFVKFICEMLKNFNGGFGYNEYEDYDQYDQYDDNGIVSQFEIFIIHPTKIGDCYFYRTSMRRGQSCGRTTWPAVRASTSIGG